MKFHAVLSYLILSTLLCGITAYAEAQITIDGDVSDWTDSDAQCAFTLQDPAGSDYVDVVNICVADSASTDGYFYVLLEFAEDSQNNRLNTVWLNNADVYLSIDTDGDGDVDTTIDFVNDPSEEIWGIIDLPYLEVRIDYDLVDPDGDGEFSFYVDTFWRSSVEDRVPYEDGAMLNYSIDPETGSPRAVRMLAQRAVAQDEGVKITFVTASERANAGFHVYRQTESGDFERLTDTPIPGQGDAAFGREYTFFDSQGLPGDRYRIADLEFSGKTHTHRVFKATDSESLVDSFIPRMTARFDVPYQFEKRVRKWFANAVGPRSNSSTSFGMKYLVERNALYLLSDSQLAEARLVAPHTQLTSAGRPVPAVRTREGLYFVAAPTLDRYADYDVVTARNGTSKRMTQSSVQHACRRYVTTARHTEEIEQDVRYSISTPTDDPFYWATVYSGMSATLDFDLAGWVDDTAQVRISLAGFAGSSDGPDHEAAFLLNGTAVGHWQWDGKNETVAQFTLPKGVLSSRNQLQIELVPGALPDMLSVDRMSVTYTRTLALNSGELQFEASPGTCVKLTGVTSEALLFDVTGESPVQLVGAAQTDNELVFRIPRSRKHVKSGFENRVVYAALKNSVEMPVPDAPPQDIERLKAGLDADYLIITHPLFAVAAERLAAFYNDTMSAQVVTTTELYDLYTGGRPHPNAIRQFLLDAVQTWQTPPSYVLLMGGSTVDSNDVLDTGDVDFVPTIFYRTNLMGYEAASDVSYLIGLPDVMLGRLAVRSADEASRLVDKLLRWYAKESPMAGMSVYIADHDNSGGDDAPGAFEAAADAQISVTGMGDDAAARLYLNGVNNPKAALFELISAGADFVNFHGHAYISGWSSPQIANNEFAATLQNEHLFFLMSWSCFDGMFTSPWDDALAWEFVAHPTAGGYGALATSSLADPAYVELYARLVTEELAGETLTIGEAVNNARQMMLYEISKGALDTLYTYNLLADPAAPNPWAQP